MKVRNCFPNNIGGGSIEISEVSYGDAVVLVNILSEDDCARWKQLICSLDLIIAANQKVGKET